jgi:phosphatidylglycerol:prolipoprotein diacylglycerol transferase
LHIRWYSVFMVVSILLGLTYLLREGERRGYDPDMLSDVALWMIVGGVVGARLGFVLFNEPSWFLHDWGQIARIWTGGLSWHGAVAGGIAGAWLRLRRQKAGRLPLEELLDLAVPGLAIGIVLVRFGNVFNHEVLGRPTAYFPGGRWPAQFVGAAIGAVLLVRYFRLRRTRPPVGVPFWSTVFWYSVLRGVFEETVRQSPLLLLHMEIPRLGIGFLTVLQVFTPFILVATALLWRRAAQRGWPPGAGATRPSAGPDG